MTDPPRTRRRGADLERAIHRAVLEEIMDLGYAGASLDGIARRARVGRMSLYRRWPGKPELVLDTVRATLPPLPQRPGGAPLRTQLIAILEELFVTDEHLGMLALQLAATHTTEIRRSPVMEAVQVELLAPRLAVLQDAFREARDRGEAGAGIDVELLARTGLAVLFQNILATGEQPTRAEVAHVVDGLLLPAAR
jgi:AcrR family transcriptional regulator